MMVVPDGCDAADVSGESNGRQAVELCHPRKGLLVRPPAEECDGQRAASPLVTGKHAQEYVLPLFRRVKAADARQAESVPIIRPVVPRIPRDEIRTPHHARLRKTEAELLFRQPDVRFGHA